MDATIHVFTKTDAGGVQRVVTRDGTDARQIALVCAHLKDIASRFQRRDFSGPTHVHGTHMAGLATLRAAAPDDLRVRYREIAVWRGD
jgi:hypothetical protein